MLRDALNSPFVRLGRSCLVVAGLSIALMLPAAADEIVLPGTPDGAALKAPLPQPYIVKKGDTLWGIAKRYFKDPHKWMKIWEHNLYISNPDLIYPGNRIWFGKRRPPAKKPVKAVTKTTVIQVKRSNTLPKVRLAPKVREKPVERIEKRIDNSMMLGALARQDFIQPNAVKGVGYILSGEDERINFGANDKLYLKFDSARPKEGSLFDIFRTGDPVRNPVTGKTIGVLVTHLGQVRVISEASGIYRGVVETAFEEISRGDRLKPARSVETEITPYYPPGQLEARILYIRDDAAEAGQHQVVGISLGRKDGIRTGTILSVHRRGSLAKDPVSGKTVRLPEEKIGELIVLVPQQDASIALISQSTAPINLGDAVRNQAHH